MATNGSEFANTSNVGGEKPVSRNASLFVRTDDDGRPGLTGLARVLLAMEKVGIIENTDDDKGVKVVSIETFRGRVESEVLEVPENVVALKKQYIVDNSLLPEPIEKNLNNSDRRIDKTTGEFVDGVARLSVVVERIVEKYKDGPQLFDRGLGLTLEEAVGGSLRSGFSAPDSYKDYNWFNREAKVLGKDGIEALVSDLAMLAMVEKILKEKAEEIKRTLVVNNFVLPERADRIPDGFKKIEDYISPEAKVFLLTNKRLGLNLDRDGDIKKISELARVTGYREARGLMDDNEESANVELRDGGVDRQAWDLVKGVVEAGKSASEYRLGSFDYPDQTTRRDLLRRYAKLVDSGKYTETMLLLIKNGWAKVGDLTGGGDAFLERYHTFINNNGANHEGRPGTEVAKDFLSDLKTALEEREQLYSHVDNG